MRENSPHLFGSLLTLIGVLLLTPDGLIVRLISADSWTLLFWRGLLTGVAILGFYFIYYGKNAIAIFKRMGRAGILATIFFTCSTIFFIFSLHNTSVANTLVIIATAPLFAALFSRIALKEKIRPVTLVAILISTGGIGFIFYGDLHGGQIFGNLAALGTASCLAAQLTTVRHARDADLVPSLAFSGFLIALIAIFFAADVKMSGQDFLWMGLLGLFVLPVSFGLITIGPRYISAPEVSLIMLLETFLGPLWVWLVLAEQPGTNTLLGGFLVLTTLAGHSIINLRGARTKPSPAS